MKDYNTFTFEHFMDDDFFISSVLKPTKESEQFWENYRRKHPNNLSDYNEAVRCIQGLNEKPLDEKQILHIWKNIQHSHPNQRNHPKPPIRSRWIYIVGTAVAASIALFLFLRSFTMETTKNDRENLRSFAHNNVPILESTDARLIVSDDKSISLTDKESVIQYDSTSLKVTSQETVQQEIATDKIAEYNQLIIPKGKRSFLTLSDGTQIWVNSGTRLVYPSTFKADKREIFVDGEIYLHVQNDTKRPFIVQTGDMNIQVLGTEFNVQAYHTDNQKRVVLKSGSVQVTSDASNKKIVLKPAEMYEVSHTDAIVKPVNVGNYISWIDGMYICESERLDYILTRLSRYYGMEITVDQKAAGLKCNGKLDLKESLEDVLNILKYIVPINFTSENQIYTVTHKP